MRKHSKSFTAGIVFASLLFFPAIATIKLVSLAKHSFYLVAVVVLAFLVWCFVWWKMEDVSYALVEYVEKRRSHCAN